MNSAPLTRAFLVAASTIVILAGLKAAQPIVVPILVAFFLAILTSPAVSTLVKLKLPTGLAVAIVVILLFVFLYGLGSLLVNSTDQFIERIPDYESQLTSWLAVLQDRLPWLVEDVRASINEFRPTDNALTVLSTLFSGLGSIITAVVLIVFTLIFTLIEAQSAADKVKLALGENNTLSYVNRFSKLVQRYLLVKSLISLATGLIIALMLRIIGVDYPVLWGTIAFAMNFIPNIGSLIAAVPAVILAAIQLGLPGLVITSMGYIAINMVIGNFIEPRLMGKTLDISPLVVFLSLVFWGWALGPVGMLLSIPLTVVIKIGLEVYPKTRWLAKIISQ